MKVLIEHGKTKRSIEGPFNICGTRYDLARIARLLRDAVERDPPFSFGWVEITLPGQPSIANTAPVGWDDSQSAALSADQKEKS